MARGLKFRIYRAEVLNYLCIEIKGADDRAADLRLCFRTCKKTHRISYDAAQLFHLKYSSVVGRKANILSFLFYELMALLSWIKKAINVNEKAR